MMILGWIIIGALFYYAFNGNTTFKTTDDNANIILKKRYVSGEINEETYNKMKNVIK